MYINRWDRCRDAAAENSMQQIAWDRLSSLFDVKKKFLEKINQYINKIRFISQPDTVMYKCV